MSLFVLDTDTLSLFRSGHEQVVRRVLRESPLSLVVTVISVEEQLNGWYRILHRDPSPEQIAERYERLADTASFYAQLHILNFDVKCVLRFRQLSKQKLNVKPADLRIAAIALENSATVVTRNVRDFSRVPDLAIEDWSVEPSTDQSSP